MVCFFTIENMIRSIVGVPAIVGNRIVVKHDEGTYAAYAHLQQGSAKVATGQRVEAGQVIAEVGNTGNTTQPHLHIQLMDTPTFEGAAGIPMTWCDLDLEDIDPGLEKQASEPASTALDNMPRNGQVFTATHPAQ